MQIMNAFSLCLDTYHLEILVWLFIFKNFLIFTSKAEKIFVGKFNIAFFDLIFSANTTPCFEMLFPSVISDFACNLFIKSAGLMYNFQYVMFVYIMFMFNF